MRLLSLSFYWFWGNASTMYNKDTAPGDGEQQSRRHGANEGKGGWLCRGRDSQVKGAARPIRWLQLITVWLRIVSRPQAVSLTSSPLIQNVIRVMSKGSERKTRRGGGVQHGALSHFCLLFIKETVPSSVPRSPLTTSHLHNPPDGTRYTVQGKRHGRVRCAHFAREPETIH